MPHENHDTYMSLCLKLAQKGQGYTSPNPVAGAVIVKDKKVIGSGYHKKAGLPHAEIEALKSCKQNPQNAVMYVNLEPCCHYGKTPPCTNAIVRAKVKKVVVGMDDPNPLVSGKGIAQLKKAGIQVKRGVLKGECEKINRIFTHWMKKHLPYVGLKMAISSDYKITHEPRVRSKITSTAADKKSHELRHTYDAILVGINTVLIDNPLLTDRLSRHPKNPLRIILDSRLQMPLDAKVLHDDKVIIATTKKADKKKFSVLRKKGIDVMRIKE